ncbi:MAG: hypothetical protein UCJ13_03265 [Bacteroidaceae bacterium]|nr:hypothetical protein [Bacteroidaceae bacterium]
MNRYLSAILFSCGISCTAESQNFTTSWIANDGGWEESHIPHNMLNMYVHSDGTVATICGWDEGGTNVGVFRNGKLISRPEGSGTGGWGRFSGVQVVLDEKYVYQLLTQHGCDGGNDRLNENNLRQFPPCDNNIEWKTIRRYDRETGLAAPFPGGYGYKGDMLIVAQEKERQTKGLAINKGRLYVSISGLKEKHQPDSIKIYDAQTMKYEKGYPLPCPSGILFADDHEGLWMMKEDSVIRMKAETGERLPQTIKIPQDVNAVSFSIDTKRQRLLLPNRGKDLNVLIYSNIYKQPELTGTFGNKGGVFAQTGKYKKGEAGPLRFSGPTGAGVDAKGNIYISNTSVSGGRGAVLEAYIEKDGKALWKTEGLVFTATADIDRQNPSMIYTPEKIHSVDLNKSGTRIDKLVAYTADPFTFPEDERVVKDGAFITSCWKRNIGGKSFLFVSDMYGGMMAGYRFDEKKHGYVGIPFLFANNGDPGKRPLRFWVDRNGDAKRDTQEWANMEEINPFSMSFFVDLAGNIWRGSRERGILFWEMKGLNNEGIPQYDTVRRFPLPQGCNGVKRIWYDPEKDELFVAGFSEERPDPKDTWWCMGSTIVKCKDFLKKSSDVPAKADMRFFIPFHHEDGSGNDYTNAKAFCVEGDYIFVAIAREGLIHIYDRNDGHKWGELRPDESVHKQSGWADFNYCINAYQQADGSYLIMNEENAFAKVMVYRMRE